ncbi:MAG: right-handed parallel beta-helix repeat-containing protein [Prosthecobacter sp.]|uniref:right-handed parallel beta-helix repeat-containing protein n=1 Tax=Prosthecobacter sp. TaxID=1965333 RepID=UPI00261A363D|nr:right-handed parallel beta-helix repeat-containing protein [Prosthecobacter sp.]MCF7788446.1 right-handed parallel beta-helix repeat-containing protein [Prosthecobacter sp.]
MKIILCLLLLTTTVWADDSATLAALLAKGGVVTIPTGDYHLDGTKPLPLASNMTVFAHGARFILPEALPDKARVVLFAGEDIAHFTWHGGEFVGHVFDPAQKDNVWEPNANTKGIEITTTKEGGTHDILFREVKSNGMAGAVIGVHGLAGKSSESAVTAYAERVAVESCTLLRSGKFMWDYGYLWQIMTWPEAYEPWEVERAKKYFRMDQVHEVTMQQGDDRVRFDNSVKPITVSQTDEPKEALTFLGETLPKNIVRGLQYFVVESTPEYIKIADQPKGAPIRFEGDGSGSLAFNISATYLSAYAPTGSGPGKGAFDIVGAKDVRVTGCQLSANGDTMHIQRCRNVIFANNHILGSRMGAFFLAEYCQNATITGNLVDGTNGSRVVSVEKSCTDVTMTGNTFRKGGRGAWINQPVNFIMTGNVFVNNSTKNEPDMRRGRIAYRTAKPGQFPELYFTIYEPDAAYGPVIVRDNIFIVGDSAPDEAVTFAPNGHDLQFSGNTFQNKAVSIVVDPSCKSTLIDHNQGATTVTKPVDFNHGRR